MEYFWTLFNNSTSNRGHSPNPAWDPSDLAAATSTRPDWTYASASSLHALVQSTPDPHLTSLKLGKRHYFEDATPPGAAYTKKGKSEGEAPRCQVEGCEAPLADAKDYHRRHKVCEMHAKAPRVVVLGIEQRFCQQCSRFHALAEFDESKRSCRRRLAGHNERRRKSSQEQNSLARRHSQDMRMVGAGRHPYFLNSTDCALSLLSSSSHSAPWNLPSSPDLPSRCSAALRELIAENRASLLASQMEGYSSRLGWNRAGLNPQDQTLNLMRAPSSAFGLLSVHDHKPSKEDNHQGDCSELWKVPLGY